MNAKGGLKFIGGKWSWLCSGLIIVILVSGCQKEEKSEDIIRANQMLRTILDLYDAGYKNLFNETYPYQETNKVSYLADTDTLQGKRVAYLWPTSGLFSGVNALLKATGDATYADLLGNAIIPGLENYYDGTRKPACYQSYITQAGESDRFYDDNIWLAIDFLEAFKLTSNKEYLERSKQLWEFVLSGWDNQLRGGIYWCEQKKRTKNTCSNAPAAVLAFKLFETTRDSIFFNRGLEIYNWTKTNLQDSADYLYYDNISLEGRLAERKYTYNTGQMLQSSAILYKLTGEEKYLDEAQKIAHSAINYFTEEFTTPEGKTIRLLKDNDNWFNVILFRGYGELFHVTNDPEYIKVFQNNLDYLWNHVRNSDGLFSKGWAAQQNETHKWLLDQACMVEIFASISQLQ
jgi:uncharacterized protein YyaL (SSP411 family)